MFHFQVRIQLHKLIMKMINGMNVKSRNVKVIHSNKIINNYDE